MADLLMRVRAYKIMEEAAGNARKRCKADPTLQLQGAMLMELVPYVEELESLQVIEELINSEGLLDMLRATAQALHPRVRRDLHGPKNKGV